MNQQEFDAAKVILAEIANLDLLIARLNNGDHCISVKLTSSQDLNISDELYTTSCPEFSNSMKDVAQARKRALELEFEAL